MRILPLNGNRDSMFINLRFYINGIFRFFIVALATLVFLALQSDKLLAGDSIGVAIVASTGLDDQAERKVYQYIGKLPNIKQIYVARDRNHFFEILRKIKISGKSINNLIIAGHGSANAPMIDFKKSSLMPGDVDLKEKIRQLDMYNDFKKRRQLNNEGTGSIDRTITELEKAIADIISIQEIMSENASVQLLNCSTAYTEKGRKFIHDLGKVLLTKGGGSIIASTSDVAAYQIEDRWDLIFHSVRDLEWKEKGEFYIWGDWIRYEIAVDNNNLSSESQKSLELLNQLRCLSVQPKTNPTSFPIYPQGDSNNKTYVQCRYFKNGFLDFEIPYKIVQDKNGRNESVKDGVARYYLYEKDSMGLIKWVIPSKHGKKNGTFLGYAMSRKMGHYKQVESKYVDGIIVSKKVFHENGKIRGTKRFKEGKSATECWYNKNGEETRCRDYN